MRYAGANQIREVMKVGDLTTPAEGIRSVEDVSLKDPGLYINRELSLLDFQYRVFEEAQDEDNPLLERLRFLAIVGSNMDEFYMVRVGGLKKQIDHGIVERSPDGLAPHELFVRVRNKAQGLLQAVHIYLTDTLIPELADHGICIMNYADLSERQKNHARNQFESSIFPVLTPLAFDSAHPFPHISNLSLNLAVLIKDEHEYERFARLKVPGSIPRLLPIVPEHASRASACSHTFVWVEQVIAANLKMLFPGMKVVESHPFRITRNADMTLQEMEADDLLETMEQGVRQRRYGSVLRLTFLKEMPPRMREILIKNLEADERDCYEMNGPLGTRSLMSLPGVTERFDLMFPPFVPFTPPRLNKDKRDGDAFMMIRSQNHLVHHPYDSFSPVIEFLEAAAEDPAVLAIKMTLYRVGSHSPVVNALMRARENGKQVAVLVELKARFDEESNIGWARILEQEGVHVIYGLIGLKTHSKIALVVRKEADRIQRYLHLATGNYNNVTATQYEDLGFFTADPELGADATDLFNFLTGYSEKRSYRKLLVAPINLRARFEKLIQREIKHQQDGHWGRMILKTNSLVDTGIIRLLYEASLAGVQIDLLVRGICCLKPQVPGISDNIRVISVVGRFLEHSRIYYFRNGGHEEIYLGSADLMPRNLNRRVEVLFPVTDKRYVRYLRDDVLEAYLEDTIKARYLQSTGEYVRPPRNESHPAVQKRMLALREEWHEEEKGHFWELF